MARGGAKPGAKKKSRTLKKKRTLAPKDSNTSPGKGKKKRRAKPGTAALREIRKLQKSTRFVLPRTVMREAVRWRMHRPATPITNITSSALHAIQAATEAYAVRLFEHAVLLQVHRKSKTLNKKDLEYVRRIRGEIIHPVAATPTRATP
eukprot:TRINITY_DN1577_c0_g1_i4.p1 TRINITY_DN1577_c0_g1~~TRINITY_DN1577_c0_g1_i4.p1  ORF type:complete len:149 (+),score=40.24 TRINITY_DN1577_c0_g1_i4:80-526(+)